MLRIALTIVSVVAFAGCKGGPLIVEEIIERNTNAMGGRAAIEAVQGVEVDLHVKDSGFEVDGVYHAARPGRMRIDIIANGKRVFVERFDGEKGWQWNGKEQKEEAASPTATLRHGVELPGNLFGLHEMQRRGHRIELAERQKIDGVNYYVLRVTFARIAQVRLAQSRRSLVCLRR
jgi:hypothetical protein